jgi:hypothetical protein
MNALETLLQEKPLGNLYHYTSASGLIGMIQNGKIWATDHRHLNDRKEHRLGLTLLQKELNSRKLDEKDRKLFDAIISETQKGYFVVSFSECADLLSQWRAYCPGGNGYALGFSQSNMLFKSARQHNFNLIRCIYDARKQQQLCKHVIDGFIEIKPHLRINPPNIDVESTAGAWFTSYQWEFALISVVSSLKHEGFEEEREWRLVSQYPDESLYGVSFRAGRFGVTPYFELPIYEKNSDSKINEIIIGPTSNRSASRAALEMFVTKNKLEVEKIRLSRTPLRQ